MDGKTGLCERQHFSSYTKEIEMIIGPKLDHVNRPLLNRLDNSAAHKGFLSEMQFGFQEGMGCTKASFTILETINHMLQRGSKVFSCFPDIRKVFNTVWIDGILHKLFSELGTGGRM